jgi:hypothetical protein
MHTARKEVKIRKQKNLKEEKEIFQELDKI